MYCTVQKSLSKTNIINVFLTNNIHHKKNTEETYIHQVAGMPGMSLVSHLPGGTAISNVKRSEPKNYSL